MLEWGAIWTIATIEVTPYPEFNFFFTLMVVFGLISWFCGVLFNLITRS